MSNSTARLCPATFVTDLRLTPTMRMICKSHDALRHWLSDTEVLFTYDRRKNDCPIVQQSTNRRAQAFFRIPANQRGATRRAAQCNCLLCRVFFIRSFKALGNSDLMGFVRSSIFRSCKRQKNHLTSVPRQYKRPTRAAILFVSPPKCLRFASSPFVKK